jgi:hypothetical protein
MGADSAAPSRAASLPFPVPIQLAVPLLLLLAIAAARVTGATATERLTRALASRWAPGVVGAATTTFYWWLSAEWTPYARVHDEASYLLQAQTFALGRWVNPAPPLPAFFEQYHVFVEPAFFSKYPPGHGLLMVPGIWLGLPALVPMLLHGVAGGLLFTIARHVANPWVGLITWVLWLGTGGNVQFRPTYFSEATSSAMWLGGWWALLRWRETGNRGWLLTLAACTGWMAITRPLTAAAYAVPIALVAGWEIVRHRRWKDAGLAFALGTMIVAIMPFWSMNTVGQARPTPYSLYSEVYFPWDAPGFGVDPTPPERPLNADMQRFAQWMQPEHVKHVRSALPSIFVARARTVLGESLLPMPTTFLVLAVVGLAVSGAAGAFALVSALAVLAAYLVFAHPPHWTVYYVEIEVVPPFLAAMGAWAIVAAARSRRPWPDRATLAAVPAGTALAGLILVTPLAYALQRNAPLARQQHWFAQDYFRRIRGTAAALPGEKKLVFVRYAPPHSPHNSLIANDADLASSPVWWVYDRGPTENARLVARAPDRVVYVVDEEMGWIGPAAKARPWLPPELREARD